MIFDPPCKQNSIYKQKVKVREEIEESDQYDYERCSLQSLKAFEWLSLDHCSTDESPGSVVRIPGSNFPKSPTPGFQASKEEKNKNKKAIIGGSNKYVRATSAPRLRSSSVSSSPDSNGVIRSKTQTRRELLSPLKSHNTCNRHTRCKISAEFGDAECASQHKKHIRVMGRATPGDEKQRPQNMARSPVQDMLVIDVMHLSLFHDLSQFRKSDGFKSLYTM